MLPVDQMMISLKTTQFDDMLQFYKNLLGDPKERMDDRWARFEVAGTPLVLWASPEPFITVLGAVQICLCVPDLDAAAEKLSPDVELSAVKVASHGREAFLSDPDGNRLILYQQA